MGDYMEIVYIDKADEVTELLKMLRESGERAVLRFLKQWDFGDDSMKYNGKLFGIHDLICEEGEYIMDYNILLGYFGLYKRI